MAQNEEDVILNIEVKYEDAIKGIAEYTLKVEENKKTQESLKKALQENSISEEKYVKSMAATKTQMDYNKKAIQALNKEVQNNLKIDREKEGSLNQLRASLSKANAEYSAMSKEDREAAKGKDLQKHIADITAELKKEEQALGDHRRSVGNYAIVGKELKEELKEITNQLIAMAAAGEKDSDKYKELAKRAAELKDAAMDVNATIKNGASDTANTDAALKSVQGLVGVYGVYKSVMAQFNLENEKLEETMKSLMVLQTSLQSLQSFSLLLQKQSIVYQKAQQLLQKVGISQTVAQAKAEAASNTIKGTGTIATKAVAAAQWLWNAALAANPVILIVSAIAALVIGVTALTKAFGSSANATKEAEKTNKAYETQAKKTSDTITKINNDEKNAITERSNALRKEILDLKSKGATQTQIAEIQRNSEKDIRDEQYKTSQIKQKQLQDERDAVIKAADAQMKVVNQQKNNSKKYNEQLEVYNELARKQNEIVQSIKEEVQLREGIVIAGKEAIQQEKEDRAAAYKDYQAKLKERADKQREAVRQAEDTALAIVKEGSEKQRQSVNQSYYRQIEDLKRRLSEEKKLTVQAKEAINQTIINLEQKQKQELDKISEEEIKKRIDNEIKIVELWLQSVKEGTDAEYKLRLQQLSKQQEAELNNTELTEEMKHP
jgi:hypothetical protein